MTTYNEGDWITATHPDGYTVSGPLTLSESGVLRIALRARGVFYIYPSDFENDGYTITPGKPADLSNLSNPVTEQDMLESAITAARHLNGVTGGKTPANAEYLRGQVELIEDAFWRVIDAYGGSGKSAIEARILEPEPVKVPTGVGAVVKGLFTLLVRHEAHNLNASWLGSDGLWYSDDQVAEALRNGGKVLSEGIEL